MIVKPLIKTIIFISSICFASENTITAASYCTPNSNQTFFEVYVNEEKLGTLYFKLGQYNAALDTFESYFRKNIKNSEPQLIQIVKKAYNAYQNDDEQECFILLKNAANQGYSRAHHYLGLLYQKQNKLDEAALHYALKWKTRFTFPLHIRTHNFYTIWNAQWEVEFKTVRCQQIKKIWKACLDNALSRGDSWAKFYIAIILFETKQYTKAYHLFKEIKERGYLEKEVAVYEMESHLRLGEKIKQNS